MKRIYLLLALLAWFAVPAFGQDRPGGGGSGGGSGGTIVAGQNILVGSTTIGSNTFPVVSTVPSVLLNGGTGAALSGTFGGTGAGLNLDSTNVGGFGDSWISGINGDTGATDTNVPWLWQAAHHYNWNFTNYAVSGLGTPGDVSICFSNQVKSNQLSIFALVQNDVASGTGNTPTNWSQAYLAQLARLCFATNDPSFMTAVAITNAITNGQFFPRAGWNRTANSILQGYGSTTNGAGLVTTNVVGTGFILCVDGFTNGTGATFSVTIDAGTAINCQATTIYWQTAVAYTSNSIPIAYVFENLSPGPHTVAITNTGTGANTNLNINYIAVPDMRIAKPKVIAVGGAADPPFGGAGDAAVTVTLNQQVVNDVLALNQMGLPVGYFNSWGAIPFGPHSSTSVIHPSAVEYTNIYNAFVSFMSYGSPNSYLSGNLALNNLANGTTPIPLLIPSIGEFINNGSYAGLFFNSSSFTTVFPVVFDDMNQGKVEFEGNGSVDFRGDTAAKIISGSVTETVSPAGFAFTGGPLSGNGSGLTNTILRFTVNSVLAGCHTALLEGATNTTNFAVTNNPDGFYTTFIEQGAGVARVTNSTCKFIIQGYATNSYFDLQPAGMLSNAQTFLWDGTNYQR